MSCDNTRACPCTAACPRHGKCCACVAHHRDRGQVPGCFFSAEGEASYDRSFAALVRDRGTPSVTAEGGDSSLREGAFCGTRQNS